MRDILNKIGIDKYQHFAVAAIAAFVLKNGLSFIVDNIIAALIASGVVFAACVGKEIIYDKWMGKGSVEWQDLFAGIIGIIIAIL